MSDETSVNKRDGPKAAFAKVLPLNQLTAGTPLLRHCALNRARSFTSSHTGAGESVLEAHARASSTRFSGRGDIGYDTAVPTPFDIPEFSTVSLLIVWGVDCVAGLFCLLLCDLYVNSTDEFRFTYFLTLGSHLNVLAGVLVYLLGRKRYGKKLYKFYQPFSGGVRFVTLQFFGVTCVASSLLSCITFGLLFDPSVQHAHGFLSTIAALALFGNILLLASLRSFSPYATSLETPTSAQLGGPGRRTGAALLAKDGLNVAFRFLRRRPNAESALEMVLLVAQNVFSYVAINFPQLQATVFVLNLVITLACGTLSLLFVGHRESHGYTGFRFFMSRTSDTSFLWITRLVYLLAVFANVLLVNASDERVQSSSVLAVQGLNVVSCAGLLLFMRTTRLETPLETAVLPHGVVELGGFVAVGTVFFLSCVNVGIYLYIQNFPAGLDGVIEGTAWTYHGVLVFVTQVAQLVSLLPTPLVYIAGAIIHGDRFRMLTPGREAATFPVLAMQGLSYLLYIAAVINFVLFLTSKVATIGVLESNFAMLSVICMAGSVRVYSSMLPRLDAILFKADEHNYAAGEAGEKENQGHREDGEAETKQPSTEAHSKAAAEQTAHTDSAAGPAAGVTPPPQSVEELNPLKEISYVMNGQLTISYLLCLTNVMLRLLVEISLHRVWGNVELPHARLIAIGDLCFVASVPLAHYSAKDKGIRIWHPFSGSGSFVALQVLGWMIYAMFVIALLFSSILKMNADKVPTEWTSAMAKGTVPHTLVGLLELIPVGLITISIAIEARCTLTAAVQQRLAKESFLQLRRILRAEVAKRDDDEKAVTQVAFETLMTASLHSFSVSVPHSLLRLYKDPAEEKEGHPPSSSSTTSSSSSSSGDSDEEEESQDSAEWMLESSDDAYITRQRRQEGARVIVILLCFASASFFLIAAFTAQVVVLSLAFAVVAMVATSVSTVGIHAGYGLIMHSRSDNYAPFMPFRGGSPFVLRQMAGWSCYAGAFLVTLISCVESAEVSATAMVIGAMLSVCSQVFILSSIPAFSDRRGEPTFLEVNGEGIVALLTFTGAFAFGHAYAAVIAFFKADTKTLLSFQGGGASRRTRVPFVLAVMSLSLAVPFTMIALSRTKRQWQRVIDNAKTGVGASTLASAVLRRSHTEGSTRESKRRPRPSTSAPSGEPRSMLATGIANLLEVLVILVGTVTPLTILFVVYYFSTHYTPRLVELVENYLPLGVALTLLTLALSVVPYIVNVGVPPAVITLRVTLVTWLLYGIPVVAASMLVLPYILMPRYSTRFLFGSTLVLTLVGNFKKVRFMIKLAVYFSIGHLTYQKYVFYQESDAFTWGLAARITSVHLLDCLLLGFWLAYIPTYDGKPFHTGSQRSMWFTNFARRYLFADAQRYFHFSVIVDDPRVQMRDGTTQFLFSFHPHGVFPGTALFASLTQEWAKKVGINAQRYVSTHAASIIFNVPLVRDFNLRVGALSVSRRTLEASLKRGNSVLIVTGGQAEMLHTAVSQEKMTLITQHTGFVRLAIATKAPLVPIISFAENNVLGLLQFPRIQHFSLKILGFPFPMIPYGRFGMPVPFRTRLTAVVGPPLEIPAGADENNPEDVRKLSETYFQSLRELFYRHRAEAGYPNMELELINDKERAAERKTAREAAAAEKRARKAAA